MNRGTLARILNRSALGLLLIYIVGIVVMFAAFRIFRFDDDLEFAFAVYYLLWGGVSLLVGVLLLMVAKTLLARE